MTIIGQESTSTGKGQAAAMLLAVLTLAACGSGGDSFARSETYTSIYSEIGDATIAVPGSGSATYDGVAQADFGAFGGTADATLTANFDTATMSGSFTDWSDLSPETHSLQGELILVNGDILADGSFSGEVYGNIERNPLGPNGTTPNFVDVYAGIGTGQLYDNADGDVAQIVDGGFSAIGTSSSVSGSFVARQ